MMPAMKLLQHKRLLGPAGIPALSLSVVALHLMALVNDWNS